MESQKNKRFSDSLFYKWFLNNQAVIAILITLLVFLTVFLFTKISFVFAPVVSFLTVIMLPIVISALLYYLIKPLVDFLEKRVGLSRVSAIFTVFTIIVILLIWAGSGFFPMIRTQVLSFVENLPGYIRVVNSEADKLLQNTWLTSYQAELQEMLANITSKAVDYAESFSKNALDWASNFAGAIARVTVAILISPFILFYFLRDSGKMKNGLLQIFPTKFRRPTARVLGDINKQLSGYVQGQVTVAIIVGLMFAVMYSIVGLRYAVTFGILAGFLNMVPYLGSFLAQLPVIILAMVQGPFMVVKIAIVFVIEQTIEGRFVSPLVLGSKLSIHPLTIMFILLTAGSMFGVWGVFLGIPIYASVKVIVKEIFDWYKAVSGLYEEDLHVKGEKESEDAK